MSTFDQASLVMIPSGYKTSKVYSVKPTDGSGDLAFTRSNDTATRVGPDGLIEKVRTNLALRSQSFATSAVWATVNGTVTNNAGTAPDGTNTASKIVATDSDPFVYQPLTLSGSVVVSCYVKGIGSSIGKNGSIRAGSSLTVFTITGDWQRVSLVHSAGGAQNYGLETPESAAVSDEVLLWGFQVEYGDVATDYIATTSAAVSVGPVANVPRLDYLNSSCPRLLLEPQRTNLITYSEQFDNAAWVIGQSGTGVAPVVTANNAISPDGTQNADTVVFNSGAGTTASDFSTLFQTFGGTTATYTGSFYAKTASGTAQIQVRIDGNNYDKFTITNQWQRFTLTKALTGTGNIFEMVIRRGLNEPMNASATIQLWGVQVELGAYATSYIPTLGAAVTRGADAASKTGISSLIGQSEGVVFVDFEVTDPAAFQPINIYNNNKAGNTISTVTVQFNVNTVVASFFFGNGTFDTITLTGGGYGLNQRLKVAFRYKSGELALYVNGVQKDTDSATYTANGTKSEIFLGDPTVYFAYKGGFKLYDFLQFPTSLTNAQLAELTTL